MSKAQAINWYIEPDWLNHIPTVKLHTSMRAWAKEVCLGETNQINLRELRDNNFIASIALYEHEKAGRVCVDYIDADKLPDLVYVFPTQALADWWLESKPENNSVDNHKLSVYQDEDAA